MIFDLDFAVRNFKVALTGIPTTLIITAVAAGIGLPLAFFIALARIKKVPVLDKLLTLFISFMRGTPTIVQIYLIYNGIPILLKYISGKFNLSINVSDINPIIYAFIVYSLNTSASYSEMWRAGLNAIDKGQLEAAQTAGLTLFSAYRHVIIPQAVAVAIPSFCTATLNMLKNTSLAFIMTVQDITARAKIAAGLEYKYLECYFDVFIVYLIVCTILEILFKQAEKKLTQHRQPSKAEKGERKSKNSKDRIPGLKESVQSD